MDYKYATSDLNRRHELKVMHMAFPGITNVRIATKEQDISGYDYALTHPRIPQELFIDVKRARAGRKRYWKNDIPDVTIELVNNGLKGTIGWSLDTSKMTDAYLFLWDDDLDSYAVMEAKALWRAVKKHKGHWCEEYFMDLIPTGARGVLGTVVFLPVDVLRDAVANEQKLAKNVIAT